MTCTVTQAINFMLYNTYIAQMQLSCVYTSMLRQKPVATCIGVTLWFCCCRALTENTAYGITPAKRTAQLEERIVTTENEAYSTSQTPRLNDYHEYEDVTPPSGAVNTHGPDSDYEN